MAKECIWYNGETACYELLDFDPNGLPKKEIRKKAWAILENKYSLLEEDEEMIFETLYLININNLEKI